MKLEIAGFTIEITSEHPLFLEEGYRPFLRDENMHTDLDISCYAGLPKELLHYRSFLFEASNQHQHFYSIFSYQGGLGFYIYDQQELNVIQQIAVLDASYRHWKVYSEPLPDGSLFPLRYPMGPIVMYYLCVNNPALMMHASGIYDGKKGRIFSGFSGAGKSTMSGLWHAAGSRVINDDRLIIRKEGDDFFMYNTPMYYADIPKKSPLHSIHLIEHGLKNDCKEITGAAAVSKVLAFCIQHNFNPPFIANHLAVIAAMCAKIPVFQTAFLPEEAIVHYIQENNY